MTRHILRATVGDMKLDGAAVERARKSRSLSRERLARLVNCSTGTILRIERGDGGTAAETVAAIAVALDVPLDSLFTEEVPA